jgi:hypothetical protein
MIKEWIVHQWVIQLIVKFPFLEIKQFKLVSLLGYLVYFSIGNVLCDKS